MSALQELVAGVAHKINNPINFIHGNLTHLTDYTDDLLSIAQLCHGSGIDPAITGKIFKPFFTTKPVGEGTGLGLTNSHQIITEQHQGFLSFHSVSDGGTEFMIQLPYAH